MFTIPKVVSFAFAFLMTFQIHAQNNFKNYLQSEEFQNSRLIYFKEINSFYAANNYRFVWLNFQRKDINALANFIATANSFGLNSQDYEDKLITSWKDKKVSINTGMDSINLEVSCMDMCFHFCHDLSLGNQKESLGFNGLNYNSSCVDLVKILLSSIQNNTFQNISIQLEPINSNYLSVKKVYNQYLNKVNSIGFRDVIVKKTNTLIDNRPLLIRLFHHGVIDDTSKAYTEIVLKNYVRQCQRLFSLLDDGKLRSTFLYELNVPIDHRITELKRTLNFIRWSRCFVDKNQILIVNIPSANLFLFDHGKIGEETKIIVGKRATPTPTLSSTVSEVVLYPYWNVPYKIATREMLPLIKRNPAYLEKNGFQVLNHLGKRVNASSIAWNSLSVNYFPYTIRQSTGCDNALGLYKLNFYNPFSVYLHDTPGKYLFNMNKRYFSHGCMRMQRANEIAHYVLKGNEIAIDTLEEKGCLLQQQPIHVPVTNPLSVLVVYHTAWFDASGKVMFYEDVYRKNKF